MIYNSEAHITNKHPKHSMKHAYSLDGEFLGHIDGLKLFTGWDFDRLIVGGNRVIYDSHTCTYTVSSSATSRKLEIYEVVLTQNSVILGYRKIW